MQLDGLINKIINFNNAGNGKSSEKKEINGKLLGLRNDSKKRTFSPSIIP